MKLGVSVLFKGGDAGELVSFVELADRLGYDSVWTAEAYGADVVTVLSFLAARTSTIELCSGVMQIPARTPANTAMTALTLDALSGGRFNLGIGVSGPQVVEGWHGVSYGKPLARTREYVEIVRQVVAREGAVDFSGSEYQIPYRGADATGLGKPLRSILHPVRKRIPIWLAAMGPRNLALTAEIADGWIPMFYSPEKSHVFDEYLDQGRRRRRIPEPMRIAASVPVAVGDDLATCRDAVRPHLALYVGGMGARNRNFYNDLAVRLGYEQAAARIQDHYLAGRKDEAAACVPDEFVDEVALVGPIPRVLERLDVWSGSGVDTLVLNTRDRTILGPIREHVA